MNVTAERDRSTQRGRLPDLSAPGGA